MLLRRGLDDRVVSGSEERLALFLVGQVVGDLLGKADFFHLDLGDEDFVFHDPIDERHVHLVAAASAEPNLDLVADHLVAGRLDRSTVGQHDELGPGREGADEDGQSSRRRERGKPGHWNRPTALPRAEFPASHTFILPRPAERARG